MIALHPQFIVDEAEEKKAVVIPFNEWLQILNDMEELEDIKLYDQTKADKDDETINFDQLVEEFSENN